MKIHKIQEKINKIKKSRKLYILGPAWIVLNYKTEKWKWSFGTGMANGRGIPKNQSITEGECKTLEDAEKALEDACNGLDVLYGDTLTVIIDDMSGE